MLFKLLSKLQKMALVKPNYSYEIVIYSQLHNAIQHPVCYFNSRGRNLKIILKSILNGTQILITIYYTIVISVISLYV